MEGSLNEIVGSLNEVVNIIYKKIYIYIKC